jgi:hypothetical protein
MTDPFTSIELYCKNTIYTERNTVLSIPKVLAEIVFFYRDQYGVLPTLTM